MLNAVGDCNNGAFIVTSAKFPTLQCIVRQSNFRNDLLTRKQGDSLEATVAVQLEQKGIWEL